MTDRFALTLFAKYVLNGEITVSVGISKPVVITGKKPGTVLHIHINNSKTLRRIVYRPNLAIGEAYMDGSLTIENDDLDALMKFLMENSHHWRRQTAGRVSLFLSDHLAFIRNWNKRGASRRNVAHHYDLTDRLFNSFLDTRRQYSCSYYDSPDVDLNYAQNTKIARIAAKLNLSPGDHVLDIGCGWGGLANALVECEPSARVTGITLSSQQLDYARNAVQMAGNHSAVDFHLRDYRDLDGSFDKIVSVGMLEHVGPINFDCYFNIIKRRLAPNGVALIHSIGVNNHPSPVNRWLSKYIFPGGYLPSLDQMINTIAANRITVLDIEIMRNHYAETLRGWRRNFQQNIAEIQSIYDEPFIRMWNFYLAGCEYFFRTQHGMVFQLQLAHDHAATPFNRRYIGDLQDRFRETLCKNNPSGNENY